MICCLTACALREMVPESSSLAHRLNPHGNFPAIRERQGYRAAFGEDERVALSGLAGTSPPPSSLKCTNRFSRSEISLEVPSSELTSQIQAVLFLPTVTARRPSELK